MAYCRKCGAEIDDEAVICPKCGVQQKGIESIQPQVDNDFQGYLLISFLLPIVGFILGFYHLGTKPVAAKNEFVMACLPIVLAVLIYAGIVIPYAIQKGF